VNRVLFTFVVSPSTFTLQFFSTCCKASVPPFVHAVVPPSEKWRLLRNVTRVTSCIGVAGVSVAGNSFVSSIRRHGGSGNSFVSSIRRHGGRGEVGGAEGVSVAGNSFVSSIRRHGGRGEVGVAELTACPRFTLEDQGRSTTISSKRRHHIVSGSGKAPQPLSQRL